MSVEKLRELLPMLDEALEDLEIWGRHSDQGYRKLKDWYRKALNEVNDIDRDSKFTAIRKAIENYSESLADNVMEDGRMRWEYYGVQRRIAQAAYNFNGYIVTGTRHGCPIMRLQMDAIGREVLNEWCPLDQMIQGFTDQYGNFLTRQEAYPIALAAGQIIRTDHRPGTLYSECYI